jgi:pimeloyl-ACP methyl ester carboxylesterase
MKTLLRDGETLAYATPPTAAGATPRTIVLAHNLMCDHEVFADLATDLERDYRVVTVDIRGHGASTARAPFEIADAALDLTAILDREGVDAALVVGLSLGASMAMELALREPARVLGMVLLAPCGEAATRSERVRDAFLVELVAREGLAGELATRTVEALFGPTFRASSPDITAAWEEKLRGTVPAFAAHALGAWSRRRTLLGELARVTVPVTVVVGEEDARCPPSDGEKVHAALGAAAQLVRLAATGHTMTVERPAEIRAAVRGAAERVRWRE